MADMNRSVQLVAIRHPFFATILLQQHRVETDQVPTMGVDGVHLFWNKEWTKALTESEAIGVLAHECMHVVLQHHVRRKELEDSTANFSSKIWNVAADFVINALLLEDNDIKLPSGGCTPDIWELLKTQHRIYCKKDLRQMQSEEVYHLLMNHLPKEEIDKLGESADSDVMPAEDDTITAAADAMTMANSAYATAKQAGNLPGYIEELMGRLREPQANWRAELWQFMQTAKQTGYSFTRPNRRYIMSNAVMPSHGAKGMPALNCIFDSSGSVSGAEFTQFLSELNGAAEAMGIKDIICVVCDTEVQAVHHRSVSEGEITFAAKGRGGTILDPAFEVLKEYRPAPTICFSDGYFNAPPQPPYPLLWCFTSDQAMPYGRHVRIKA